MKFCLRYAGVLFSILTLLFTSVLLGAESASIQLPSARMEGGKPFMQTLRERKTSREFSSRELPLQVLSDLLWAANGVNRPETKGRTAPSAHNLQAIDIYVALSLGLYRYDPFANVLEFVLAEDIRAVTGKQDFVKYAPVNLVFVLNGPKDKELANQAVAPATIDAGFISENVYLYCASEGLATVVRGWFEAYKLGAAMKLSFGQKAVLAQTVGYPKEK